MIRLLALLLGLAAAQDLGTKIINLNYRSASDLVPIIQSTYGDKVHVSAYGSKLILRADPPLLTEAEGLVSQLDTRGRRLRISVKNADTGSSKASQLGLSGSTRSGIRAQVNESSTTSRSHGERFVVTDEGVPAAVANVPAVDDGGALRAVAHVQGDKVTVDLVDAHGNIVQSQGVSSHVTGPLGQWMEVGGVNQNSDTTTSGILNRGSARSQGFSNLMLKVELEP